MSEYKDHKDALLYRLDIKTKLNYTINVLLLFINVSFIACFTLYGGQLRSWSPLRSAWWGGQEAIAASFLIPAGKEAAAHGSAPLHLLLVSVTALSLPSKEQKHVGRTKGDRPGDPRVMGSLMGVADDAT